MTALALVLAGILCGGLGTGVLMRRYKRQDDLEQWQRGEMLRAIADFIQAHTNAHRVAAGDTGYIDFRDTKALTERANAHRVARNDTAALLARVELLYGSESVTARAALELLRAHDRVSRALTDGILPPAQDDQDVGTLDTNLALAFDALVAPQAALYDAARRDIAKPASLTSGSPVPCAASPREVARRGSD